MDLKLLQKVTLSLPESLRQEVIEAQSQNVPKWELVTERLLHEETKLQQKNSTIGESRALAVNGVKPVHSSFIFATNLDI